MSNFRAKIIQNFDKVHRVSLWVCLKAEAIDKWTPVEDAAQNKTPSHQTTSFSPLATTTDLLRMISFPILDKASEMTFSGTSKAN